MQEQKSKGVFKENVYFVRLTELQTNTQILSQIAVSMGLGLQASSDLFGRIIHYLHPLKVLLVLDNFEHLLQGNLSNATRLMVDLKKQCPELKLLITSRQVLNIEGEVIVDVKGLSFPKNEKKGVTDFEQTKEEFAAIDLFVRRAKEVVRDFRLTKANVKKVIKLCQWVEGFPLGIKLAASHVKFYSLDEIVESVEQKPRLTK